MKAEIKIIQDYFLNKIYNCDFEIVSADEHRVEILIDREFTYHLWIANGFECFRISNEFMREPIVTIKSINSKMGKAWTFVNKYIKETKEPKARAEKVALIEKLTKELNQ